MCLCAGLFGGLWLGGMGFGHVAVELFRFWELYGFGLAMDGFSCVHVFSWLASTLITGVARSLTRRKSRAKMALHRARPPSIYRPGHKINWRVPIRTGRIVRIGDGPVQTLREDAAVVEFEK